MKSTRPLAKMNVTCSTPACTAALPVKENVLPPLTADLPFKIVLVHNVVAGPAGARDSVVMR